MRSNVGARGFEPPTCRRGDRSITANQVRLDIVRSCSIARVALLRIDWQSLRCKQAPTECRVSLPWNPQRYADEFARLRPRKSPRSVVQFFDFLTRNNKTLLSIRRFMSGREDLNLRPRGPKPRALPS